MQTPKETNNEIKRKRYAFSTISDADFQKPCFFSFIIVTGFTNIFRNTCSQVLQTCPVHQHRGFPVNIAKCFRLSKQIRKGVPNKVGNWHALSHEQYLSKHQFLDIFWCAFYAKINKSLFPRKLSLRVM